MPLTCVFLQISYPVIPLLRSNFIFYYSGSRGKIGFRELAREVSSQWKATSPEDKAPFEAMAEADKQRHQREMAEYNMWLKEQEDKERAASALEASRTTGATAIAALGTRHASPKTTPPQHKASRAVASSVPLVTPSSVHAVTPPPSTTYTFLNLAPPSTGSMDQLFRQISRQLVAPPPRQPTVADLAAQLDPASQELLIRALLMQHHSGQT